MEEKIQILKIHVLFCFSIVLMVLGLVFLRIEIIALPCIGVGGSILATVIVNWMFTRYWHGLPIPQIAEAMAQHTQFMRTEQKAELTFSIDKEKELVRVEKRHSYKLKKHNLFKRNYIISMFTDASILTPSDYGGFKKVKGPDGKKLEGDELKKYIKDEPGKHTFFNKYYLTQGDKQDKIDKNKFEFVSYDYYRLLDRLIWTVQDLSDGFTVQIKNKTNIQNPFKIKINHHKEKEIQSLMEKKEDTLGEIYIEFNSHILPYQGFEIMWNFSEKTPDDKQ
jgi:hypothetical protein